MPLHIAHLSDIHFFCDPAQIGHDPNEHMRNELLQDLVKQAKRYGGLHAILISGDIAYGGRTDEYELANNWIQELCEKTGCPVTGVFVCPGNHDIDHTVLKKRIFLEDAHKAIRSESNNEKRDEELAKRLQAPDDKALFYEPLENFNNFAKNYNCCFFADRDNYAWCRDLALDDGSILRIRGLNSAILSGQKDERKSLFLGRRAWSIDREDGVEHLIFSHHPPVWLLDGDEMQNALNDRARIQLYGHEHDARIEPHQRTIKLYAGAVNPHRSQNNWLPGYNFVQILVNSDGQNRTMTVRIHAREWQDKSPAQFKAYAGDCSDDSHEVQFKLSPWTAKSPISVKSTFVPSSASLDDEVIISNSKVVNEEHSLDKLIYPFMQLDRLSQKAIIEQLNLEDNADNELPDFIKLKKALQRAKELERLAQLENLIRRTNSNDY
jgi:hypothetical protein